MTASLVDDELEVPTMQVIDLRDGLGHVHADGHASDHVNGHANGHANGTARRRDDFALAEVATFLSGPLVSTGFAPAAATAHGAAAPPLAPAMPALPHVRHDVYARAGKRLVDLVGGLAALALAGPIILLAALAVRLTSRGPAFYKSTRLGKNGRPFTFYKLRSMYVGADAERAK